MSTPEDLFVDKTGLKDARRIYTVSGLNQDIKLILENAFAEVWVEGEVSGLCRIATGTTFFSLKDNQGLLRCVLFPSSAGGVKFQIKDGMQMVCFGRVSVYEKEGKYQLYVQKLEPKGVGSLQLALEQLKERLEKEGLFKQEHKKPIPYLPERIGVVTSPTGAAIKDILKVLDRRFKDTHIIINPVRVQGEGAAEEIACAIKDFNRMNDLLPEGKRIEVMIVGRGGGSIEDLWAFNEEVVCRAIYVSRIPVISAVGHERDITVADLVADLRAPTPSVAAELVIPRREDLEDKLNVALQQLNRSFNDSLENLRETLDEFARRLGLSMEHILELNSAACAALTKKLKLLDPCVRISQYKIRAIDLARQIYVQACHLVQIRHIELSKAAANLSALSPLNILSRGYSITFSIADGHALKDTQRVKIGDMIRTRLSKGEIISTVKEIDKPKEHK